MPWWISAIGAVIGGLATFVISWSALKPRQRLFATKLVSKWAYRAALAFAAFYFLWVNLNFAFKTGAIGRLEVLVLLLANAEALLLLILFIFGRIFGYYLEKRNERWTGLMDRLRELEALRDENAVGGAAITTERLP